MAEFIKPSGVILEKTDPDKPRGELVPYMLQPSHLMGNLLEVESHHDPMSNTMRVRFTIEMTTKELYDSGGIGWLIKDRVIRISQ